MMKKMKRNGILVRAYIAPRAILTTTHLNQALSPLILL